MASVPWMILNVNHVRRTSKDRCGSIMASRHRWRPSGLHSPAWQELIATFGASWPGTADILGSKGLPTLHCLMLRSAARQGGQTTDFETLKISECKLQNPLMHLPYLNQIHDIRAVGRMIQYANESEKSLDLRMLDPSVIPSFVHHSTSYFGSPAESHHLAVLPTPCGSAATFASGTPSHPIGIDGRVSNVR